MDKKTLIEEIKSKQSFLCVGLDVDLDKIPSHLLDEEDPIFTFNKAIIDATKDYTVAYKPNIAFYESLGYQGWQSLEKTLNYIPKNCFTIADAKRGDIGNTAKMYASTFFNRYQFDSVTIAPYMGRDSIQPFLDFEGKWTIILGLTSNAGAFDFQFLETKTGSSFFEEVIAKSAQWGDDKNTMYVVGATKTDYFRKIRNLIPNHFLLVPGVGAQGGSLEEVCEFGLNKEVGLLVNSSRGIIYASNGKDFAEKAADSAEEMQKQMASILRRNQII